MTQHSPGPWNYCGADRGGCQCGHVWSADDMHVATAHWAQHHNGRYSDEGEVAPFSESVFKANMRLIAAAPAMLEENKQLRSLNAELLKALQTIERAYDSGNWMDRIAEDMHIVRAAIAKAEGR